MEMIKIEAKVKASLAHVWDSWTNTEDIMAWNHASDDWHCPAAENNLVPGGTFTYHMAAKDGSVAFDFHGTYQKIEPMKLISYYIEDGRYVEIRFEEEGEYVHIVETFEPEEVNGLDLQQQGWQLILNNFKVHTELTSA
jgi:uncharacterized protein YndB with AHSA1/START domain